MAATRGQQIQDRYHRDARQHHFLRQPVREAGVKTRQPIPSLATTEPIS
jgi:hypothetical protein